MVILKRFSMLFILILLVGCQINEEKQAQLFKEREIDEVTKERMDWLPETYELTIAAIGDLLIHDRVYDEARTETGFDFMPMVDGIKDYLTDVDITTANQESMIGGEEHGLSSYPQFNSPQEVGDMVSEMGVDIVNLANNHTLDRGEAVIYSALDYWDELGILYTGSYRNEEDQAEIRVIEKNNISVSFLGYSYGTNGIPIPEGKDYLINLIDQQQIAQDVERAKESSDVVVMHLHFGDEYVRMPNMFQQELVQYVADLGVDIVFGHHPHVLQPTDWVESEDGQETFVIYSLGNFLSGQDQHYRQIGGIMELTIKKEVSSSSETITLESPQFLPTYVDIDDGYRMFPMKDLSDDRLAEADDHYQEIKEHMSQWMPELDFFE
ncbi:CapA family protein [Amphibacillus sp. Q70]|uniref:CapA family protein n=1 Tax=Amphibacillus sp. Q70 TaxID=3453416 RepID=UPI003F83F516